MDLQPCLERAKAHIERREEAVEELQEPPHDVDRQHDGQQHRAAGRGGERRGAEALVRVRVCESARQRLLPPVWRHTLQHPAARLRMLQGRAIHVTCAAHSRAHAQRRCSAGLTSQT